MQGGGVGGLLWGGGFFKKPSLFHQPTQFFFSGVLLLTNLNIKKPFYFVKFTQSPSPPPKKDTCAYPED